MKKKLSLNVFQLLLVIAIAILGGYFFGTNKIAFAWKNYQPIVDVQSKNPPPGQNLDMGLFYDVLARVERDYYDKSKIDSQKLLYGAIQGMLSSLDDPYTSFFPPKENKDFKTQLAGEFSGIGAELSMSPENRIMIIAPLDGSPAKAAGIQNGDLILKVDGKETFGWTLDKAVDTIRGPKGSTVTLSILHKEAKAPVDIKIKRDVIKIDSVRSWIKEINCNDEKCADAKKGEGQGSVAYVRLSQFGDRTNNEWITHINKLYPQMRASQDFKGVILDLRNNPGGYMTDAVFIASEFLKKGNVVVMQENGEGEVLKMSVEREGLLLDYPLIVLINGGSASASEIVSGALRDHERATLLGEKSFGKGTIQQAVDVENGASVHISIAKWLTPNGTWVHKEGLKPDLEVKFDASKSAQMTYDNQLNAAIQELLKK